MRKLVIINAMGECNTPLQPSIQIPPKFEPIPFSNAKSLLGNEYPYAVYDIRAENGVNFNLEAFAIVAGTIQRGGVLYLLCSDWENVENQPDLDSERWNDGKVVATPNFWVFFKALAEKYRFLSPSTGEVVERSKADGGNYHLSPLPLASQGTSPVNKGRKLVLNAIQQENLHNHIAFDCFLPPSTGEVVEHSKADGGNYHLSPLPLASQGTSPVNGGRKLVLNAIQQENLHNHIAFDCFLPPSTREVVEHSETDGGNYHLSPLPLASQGTSLVNEGRKLVLNAIQQENLHNHIAFDCFLPPYTGEVVEHSETDGGNHHFLPLPLASQGTSSVNGGRKLELNADQQKILQDLPFDPADIHLITAPRGRGKSTLSGKLAEKISQTHQVIITARSKAVLPNFWQQVESEKIRFFAPDALIQAVQNDEKFANVWLFIDEAASLPLPILQTLCSAFAKVVMTTTTQNYEGTGRGFELKLPKMLDKAFQHWRLSQPLRWDENDPLEQFVNELLLSPLFNEIDVFRGEYNSSLQFFLPPSTGEVVEHSETYGGNHHFPPLPLASQGTSPVNRGKKLLLNSESQKILNNHIAFDCFLPPPTGEVVERSETDGGNHHLSPLPLASQGTSPVNRGRNIPSYIAFYQLLSSAHYKTTPSDLRRLFDGENQRLFSIIEQEHLIAGCWAVNEGGLDETLTQAIWRGERRPKGNLVAQYLCFQGNLPQACRLSSLRISRIAVQPEMQGKGYGKRLISEIILQISTENPPLDFLSVSFGMSDELLRFWQSCGFQLVQISQNAEASSGLPSAMMIYPLTQAGQDFVTFATMQFQRNQQQATQFEQFDRENVLGFITAKRTFSACYHSLRRCYFLHQSSLQMYADWFENADPRIKAPKIRQEQLRQQLQNLPLFSSKK